MPAGRSRDHGVERLRSGRHPLDQDLRIDPGDRVEKWFFLASRRTIPEVVGCNSQSCTCEAPERCERLAAHVEAFFTPPGAARRPCPCSDPEDTSCGTQVRITSRVPAEDVDWRVIDVKVALPSDAPGGRP